MDDQRNRVNDHYNNDQHHHHHLGVNKMGKNIRKDSSNQQNQQQNPPQALVYNINKTDFRSIVQQLTGIGSTSSVNLQQTANPKPPNSRLLKVRPPPLTQVNRPPLPHPPPVQSNSIASQPVQSVNQFLVNPAESPISAYMRYLIESSPVGTRPQQQNQNPVQPSTGLFPSNQTGPLNPMPFQSPASQFAMSSPRSPFPLLSPNFAFSPRFLGGNESQPPPPPDFFFPLLSPLWRNQ